MLFCGNCGTQLSDGTAFCPNCGQRVENVVQQAQQPVQQQPVQQQPMQQQPMQQAMPPKQPKQPMSPKTKKMILISVIAAVVLVVAIVAVLLIVRYQKKKVNVNDFISVEYYGCDTAGTAEVYLDEYEFEEAVLKAQGKKVKNTSSSSDWDWNDLNSILNASSGSSDIYNLMDSIEFKIEPNENLSNGDEITVTIEYDQKLAKKVGVRLITKEQKFTVEGLADVVEVDPFEDLEVSFEGTAPNVYVYWYNASDDYYLSGLWFEVDKEDGLDVGDTVTITVDESEENALANGYRFTQTSKEYTVDSADHYLTSMADISEDTLADMQSEALDVLDVYFAEENEYITNSGFNYEGLYMLNRKDPDGWYDTNKVYLVYSSTVTSVEGDFEPTVVYFPVSFSDLLEDADGEQEFYSYNDIEGYTGLEYDFWDEVEGYTDGATMFNELVVMNKVDYTYEVSEGLQQFGN